MNKLNIVVNLCCPFQSFTSPTPPNTNTHHCLEIERDREIDKKRDKGGRRREGEKFASFFMLAQQE
jgi:hypothetical protein